MQSLIDFSREYTDKSEHFTKLLQPDEEQIEILNQSMGKFEKEDIKNCHACGYKSCENMAMAILNGLYRPEQCHHFLEKYYNDNNQ
jgi:ArsR family metal-binding transcriptional regulator